MLPFSDKISPFFYSPSLHLSLGTFPDSHSSSLYSAKVPKQKHSECCQHHIKPCWQARFQSESQTSLPSLNLSYILEYSIRFLTLPRLFPEEILQGEKSQPGEVLGKTWTPQVDEARPTVAKNAVAHFFQKTSS